MARNLSPNEEYECPVCYERFSGCLPNQANEHIREKCGHDMNIVSKQQQPKGSEYGFKEIA